MRRLGFWAAVLLLAACGAPDLPEGSHGIGSGGSAGKGGSGGGGSGGSGPPEAVTASPAAIDFAWVCAGATARAALHVANRGSDPETASIETSAPAVVDPGSVSLAPLEETVVAVRLEPPASAMAGSTAGEVVVHAPDGDVRVPWTARITRDPRGRPAALCGGEAPCTDLDAGFVTMGDEAPASFDVVNDGCADFSVTALLPRRADRTPSPELRVLDPAPPFSLAPGERRTVHLSFGPTDVGETSGDIVVQTDTPSRDEVRVPWSGGGQ
jgi:hypothetical protein